MAIIAQVLIITGLILEIPSLYVVGRDIIPNIFNYKKWRDADIMKSGETDYQRWKRQVKEQTPVLVCLAARPSKIWGYSRKGLPSKSSSSEHIKYNK
jgi:hypothetical protein